MRSIEGSNNNFNERNKENIHGNKNVNLQQFKQKQPGTFAALRKVNVQKFIK